MVTNPRLAFIALLYSLSIVTAGLYSCGQLSATARAIVDVWARVQP